MKTPEKISAEFCRQVIDALAQGEAVRCDLPGSGFLHMDRQLPFLCVYRLPAGSEDPGTAELLTSQAAYLVIREDQVGPTDTGKLIDTIAATMSSLFGAFLLLEIWSSQLEGNERPPRMFHIHAPVSNPPAELLEAMEAALLRIRTANEASVIYLDYGESILPPDKQSLLPGHDAKKENVICLGLEISPFFRDAGTGELYVFAYKKFRNQFNRALKRCFYQFTRQYTTHRPAHYHELGPQIVAEEAIVVDEQLARISEKFDLLLFVSPVNFAAAWAEFQEVGFKGLPQFLYRPRTIDPDLLKRQLYEIPIENVEDPTLFHIFNAKRMELDRQISLLSDRNTNRFLLGSRQLFGDISSELLKVALEILDKIPPVPAQEGQVELLNAQQFEEYAQQEVEYYRQQDQTLAARVTVRDDIPGVMVSHGNFLIGASAQVSRSRLNATLAHEIGTHVVTYHNGRQQPFRELYVGMAGYEPMQEGLAVLSEYLVGELDQGRVRQLAGRVVAVNTVTGGADFIETFRVLSRRHGFSPKGAFMMTMRSHRGGGYTKDAVYLKGLVGLLDKLADGKDLKSLFVGKVALEYLPLIEELRWRQVLEEPPLVPRLFTLPEIEHRTARLRQGMTVLSLVEETD